MKPLENLAARICHYCPLCAYARNHSDSAFGRLMTWHGKWCFAWKAHDKMYGSQPHADDQKK